MPESDKKEHNCAGDESVDLSLVGLYGDKASTEDQTPRRGRPSDEPLALHAPHVRPIGKKKSPEIWSIFSIHAPHSTPLGWGELFPFAPPGLGLAPIHQRAQDVARQVIESVFHPEVIADRHSRLPARTIPGMSERKSSFNRNDIDIVGGLLLIVVGAARLAYDLKPEALVGQARCVDVK
jgi:hypothetical protein